MLRGLRTCTCDEHFVFGVGCEGPFFQGTAVTVPPPGTGAYAARAIKVPAKYAPYVRSYGKTSAKALPEPERSNWGVTLNTRVVAVFEEQDEFGFPTGFFGSSGHGRVIRSRAIYTDGVLTHSAYVRSHSSNVFDGFNDTEIMVIDDATQQIVGGVNFYQWQIDNGTLWSPIENDDFPVVNAGIGSTAVGKPINARNQFYGKAYYVASTYTIGATLWFAGRFRYSDGQNVANTECGFDDSFYYVALPAIRAYLDSIAVQPDEPHVAAIKPPGTKIVLGRWQNMDANAILQEQDVLRVVYDASQTPLGNLGVVCYNRVRGRDLLIVANTSGNQYWIYDSDVGSLQAIGDSPNFITQDDEGAIYVGNPSFIEKMGPNGWRHDFASHPLWNNVPGGLFQILPTKNWIQLRGVNGQIADANPSPEIAGEDGIPRFWSTAGESDIFYHHIMCWGFSKDGTIRVPHLQESPPVPQGNSTTGADPAQPTPAVRPIIPRCYNNHPFESIWYPKTFGAGDPFYQLDDRWYGGIPWNRSNPSSPIRGATEWIDFDAVDSECQCGCRKAVAY